MLLSRKQICAILCSLLISISAVQAKADEYDDGMCFMVKQAEQTYSTMSPPLKWNENTEVVHLHADCKAKSIQFELHTKDDPKTTADKFAAEMCQPESPWPEALTRGWAIALNIPMETGSYTKELDCSSEKDKL